MVWWAFQTNVVTLPGRCDNRSTLGGQVVHTGAGRAAAWFAVVGEAQEGIAVEAWQALVAVGPCCVVQTFIAFASVWIARVGMVVAVAFFAAPTKQGVVYSAVARGTELAGEASIANWALTHLNRRHLCQGS